MPATSLQQQNPTSYEVFLGNNQRRENVSFPPAPPWRSFDDASRRERGAGYIVSQEEKEAVNAAICLRRPLLITGRPGTGKSTLALAIAEELGLGPVLLWPITSRSTLQQGLYEYDGIARVQETARWQNAAKDERAVEALAIENFLSLGPLGSALADSTAARPRVLLVDEIDKSDIDLPNDLLNVFEEGEFTIPELARASAVEGRASVLVPLYRDTRRAEVAGGRVRCRAFPIVLLTSNGEREFPPAFLRRCLRVDIPRPTRKQLESIVAKRLGIDPAAGDNEAARKLLDLFENLQEQGRRQLATDQLLNAIHLVCKAHGPLDEPFLRKVILRALSEGGS